MAPVWIVKGQRVPLVATAVGVTWIDLRAYLGDDCICIRTSFANGNFRSTAFCKVNGLEESLVILGKNLGCIENAIKWVNAETARMTAPKWLSDLSETDRRDVLDWVNNGGDAPDCIVKRAEELHADSGKCGGLDDELPDLIDGIAAELKVSA